ncbi:hypothetical protein HPB47_014545 [Ixodes persulcatus]|uniref:Uncharacterized protein n=1 Tax=Ixodes persulcatus TaxID=34615 RepID=A0AC60R0N4_IXOPE|nr:hypothetical protein HPB47_014545 [Ixodes persulcatus]
MSYVSRGETASVVSETEICLVVAAVGSQSNLEKHHFDDYQRSLVDSELVVGDHNFQCTDVDKTERRVQPDHTKSKLVDFPGSSICRLYVLASEGEEMVAGAGRQASGADALPFRRT